MENTQKLNIGSSSRDQVAFFLCDIQQNYSQFVYKIDSVKYVACQMGEFAKVMKIPVVVTEQYKKAFGETLQIINNSLPENCLKVEKTQFSMLTEEVLSFLKQNENIRQIVIFGIEAHICVQQTCFDLLQKGYDVHILVDGVSSKRKLDRSVALQRMQNAGAFLTTYEAFCFEVVKNSQIPEWKQCLQIFKNTGENLLDEM